MLQWECKTDMDNAYRFGKIEVVCEGYDYPNDDYILKGSCGVRSDILLSIIRVTYIVCTGFVCICIHY